MNLEDLGRWMLEHPKAARAMGLAVVAFGTWSYLGMLKNYVKLDLLLAAHISETARAASEALGG